MLHDLLETCGVHLGPDSGRRIVADRDRLAPLRTQDDNGERRAVAPTNRNPHLASAFDAISRDLAAIEAGGAP